MDVSKVRDSFCDGPIDLALVQDQGLRQYKLDALILDNSGSFSNGPLGQTQTQAQVHNKNNSDDLISEDPGRELPVSQKNRQQNQ